MVKLTKNGFDRMGLDELLETARVILAAMDKPAIFATPTPTLAVVQNAVDELSAAAVDSSTGDRYKIAIRKQKQEVLVAQLRQLGMYVDMVANGDLAIAIASKFPLTKQPQPLPPITYVASPVVTAGVNAGELAVKVKAVPGASYLYCYSTSLTAPLNEWAAQPCKSSRCTISELPSATRFYIRVAAVGKHGQVVYSDASSYVTQ